MTTHARDPQDSSALRKARGAFFTPPVVAAFIVEWAVRSADDSVLELANTGVVEIEASRPTDVCTLVSWMRGREERRSYIESGQQQSRTLVARPERDAG